MYLFDNINNYDDKYYDDIYDSLSKNDKNKVDKYIYDRDKKLCMLSRGLLINTLRDKYSINDIIIKYNKYGKPYTDNIFFNISHSYDYVFIGVSKRCIGVDIERIRPVSNSIINYICTDNEKEYVLKSKNINKSLFEIFCLKEAYFKMIGTGISDLKSVEFVIGNVIKCSLNNNLNIILDNSIYGYVSAVIEEKD